MDFILPAGVDCLEVKEEDKLAIFIREVPSSITYEWSFETDIMPLARSFVKAEFPTIGENVTFDPLYFPFKFSIQAQMDIGNFILLVYKGNSSPQNTKP